MGNEVSSTVYHLRGSSRRQWIDPAFCGSSLAMQESLRIAMHLNAKPKSQPPLRRLYGFRRYEAHNIRIRRILRILIARVARINRIDGRTYGGAVDID